MIVKNLVGIQADGLVQCQQKNALTHSIHRAVYASLRILVKFDINGKDDTGINNTNVAVLQYFGIRLILCFCLLSPNIIIILYDGIKVNDVSFSLVLTDGTDCKCKNKYENTNTNINTNNNCNNTKRKEKLSANVQG